MSIGTLQLKVKYPNFQISNLEQIRLSGKSPGSQAAGPQSPHCQMSEEKRKMLNIFKLNDFQRRVEDVEIQMCKGRTRMMN